MKLNKIRFMLSTAFVSLALLLSTAPAVALDQIGVAYFLEWPTPNQVAQMDKTFDKEMGVKVKWTAFDSGNDMSAAMASGKVHIAYSQGLIPFLIAVSKGLPITTVGVAVSYSEADNCVVHENAGLDRSSAKAVARSLKGLRIATPIGNVTHYKLLKTLNYFGLSERDVRIVPVSGGNDAAAAFLSDQVDIGCAFGGPLNKMKAKGRVLMTGAEQENIGILTFDVISVSDDFAREYPDMVTKFLQVTEDANRDFANNPNAHWRTLMRASGLSEDSIKGYLGSNGSFYFPSKDEQLSDVWMGGTVQRLTKGAADFFVEQKVISRALKSYDDTIDTRFLENVR